MFRAPESQFDSGVWSESAASSDPALTSEVMEETREFDKLINKLDSIGSNLTTNISQNRKQTLTSCDRSDPEDVQIKELLLSKLAKYRSQK